MYRVDSEGFDIIIGYRADEAFLMNQISVYEIERLFYKGSLGNQIFLKSEREFETICWVRSYEVIMQEEDKKLICTLGTR